MERRSKFFSQFVVITALVGASMLPHAVHAQVTPPPEPTILFPRSQSLTRIWSTQTIVKGVTKNNTTVDIFIDGNLAGQARVRDHSSGTGSFAFATPSLAVGTHTVVARATREGLASTMDHPVTFEVVDPNVVPPPEPTVLVPRSDGTTRTTPLQFEVMGYSVTGTVVDIFINGVLQGTASTRDHASGTGSFEYRPSHPLGKGIYTLSVRSRRGSLESPSDQKIQFELADPAALATVVPSGSQVKVYLDGKVVKSFTAPQTATGSYGVYYRAPVSQLSKDKVHAAFVTVKDTQGEETMVEQTGFKIAASSSSSTALTVTSAVVSSLIIGGKVAAMLPVPLFWSGCTGLPPSPPPLPLLCTDTIVTISGSRGPINFLKGPGRAPVIGVLHRGGWVLGFGIALPAGYAEPALLWAI